MLELGSIQVQLPGASQAGALREPGHIISIQFGGLTYIAIRAFSGVSPRGVGTGTAVGLSVAVGVTASVGVTVVTLVITVGKVVGVVALWA